MKVRIENKGSYINQLILDLLNQKFEFYILSGMNDSILKLPFRGYYDFIDKHLLILYKKENAFLTLKVGNFSFSITGTFSIKYTQNSDMATLSVKDEYKEAIVRYSVMERRPVSTLHYTEEEEDANFGLWLSNVLNSEERKEILLSNW